MLDCGQTVKGLECHVRKSGSTGAVKQGSDVDGFVLLAQTGAENLVRRPGC